MTTDLSQDTIRINNLLGGVKMKKFGLFIALLFTSFILGTQIVVADSSVLDQATVLSEETIQQLNQINTEKFGTLYGQPEYAVVTLSNLNGDSIEEVTKALFDQYGFGNPEYNNGLVFVFAIEDREFRLGYGDGLAFVFENLTEDDLVDSQAKDMLRDENYDGAILRASETVYNYLLEADKQTGMATIYQEGAYLLQVQRDAIRQQNRQIFFSFGGGFLAIVTGLLSLFGVNRFKIKRRWLNNHELPRWITNDSLFDQQEFITWGYKNRKQFDAYKTQDDVHAGTHAYLVESFLPKKIKQSPLSSESRQLLIKGLQNEEIELYFADKALIDSNYMKQMETELTFAQDELGNFYPSLQSALNQSIKHYDLSTDILNENKHLLHDYKQKIKELAAQQLKEKIKQGEYLAAILLHGETYETLQEKKTKEVSDAVEQVKDNALFEVDLERLYQTHPDLKERMDQFEYEDYQEVLGNVHRQYHSSSTDTALLYLMMTDQATHQEESIAAAATDNSGDFGGFSGGGSSGGGVSGSW